MTEFKKNYELSL